MDKELHRAKMRVARRFTVLSLLIVIVIGGGYVGWHYAKYYHDLLEGSSTTSIREILIESVKGLKVDAPVEPRSGDVYFPQAKLYLPAPSSYAQLTYEYHTDDDMPLSISSKTVLQQGFSYLYSAQSMQKLFESLPYLQACQRGVGVANRQSDYEGKELRHAVQLANGKTLYLYTEKTCPELHETAELLRNLKAY